VYLLLQSSLRVWPRIGMVMQHYPLFLQVIGHEGHEKGLMPIGQAGL